MFYYFPRAFPTHSASFFNFQLSINANYNNELRKWGGRLWEAYKTLYKVEQKSKNEKMFFIKMIFLFLLSYNDVPTDGTSL